jgi:hypothetical protein
MSFIKKENLVISIGEYEKNGETKQEYKTIGEIITMQGNDGPYQFFKLWGASGVTEGKVFAPRDNNPQQQGNGYAQSQPMNAPAQQTAGYPSNQPQQGHNPANGGWPQ